MAINSRNQQDLKPYSLEHIANQSFDQDAQVVVNEGLGYDGQAVQKLNANNLAILIDYDSGTDPIYIGSARPGTATSTAKWKITQFTYDSNSNVTSILYAGGTPNFDQVWDDRASLSYS